jgi:hypothetical protein
MRGTYSQLRKPDLGLGGVQQKLDRDTWLLLPASSPTSSGTGGAKSKMRASRA